MKIQMPNNFRAQILLAALLALAMTQAKLLAQGTAFTYQGRLSDGGNPATGTYDLTFALYDASSGGNLVGGPVTNPAVVVNGLFTATLDFGGTPFTGSQLWLKIGVRTNGSTGSFAALDPRQPLTSTPYAIRAADFNGTVSDNQLSANIARLDSNLVFTGAVQFNNATGNFLGAFSGNGAGLSNVDLTLVNSQGAIVFANSAATFTLASSPVVGDGPRTATVADVNGDGKPDLIVANYFGDNLTILTNDGHGGFVLSSSPDVGAEFGPFAVAAADLNGDGKLDLVSANYDTNLLTVLTNDGHGGFAVAATPMITAGSIWVAAADVNGDGKLDLISADYADRTGNTLTVLTNNGSGVFGFSAALSVGLAPHCVIAVDVNGDGKVDLISANEGGDNLTVLTNSGSGAFVLSANLPVGSGPNVGPTSVTAADVNGDGKIDLISANSLQNTLTVLTNNGSGRFVVASQQTVGARPISVTTADINRDGKVDLICASQSADSVTVLTNKGSGGFALASSPGVGPQPLSIAAAELNGDGEVDLVTANMDQVAGRYTASVLFGDRQANFVGSGAGLTSLNAANLVGTIPDARLSSNVALRTGGNVFTGNQTVTSGKVGIGTSSPAGNLDVLNGASTLSIRDDNSSGVSGLMMTGGVAPGTLRLRNILEVWPNSGGTAAARVDVRNASGAATITLSGSSGNVSAVSYSTTSDRNAKQNFRPIQPKEVLEKVAALPLSTWTFKCQEPAIRHLGPMAQDFRAAFGLGENDTTIATVDADGVALAAIQGLNQKLLEQLEQRDAQNAELERKSRLMEERLEALEKLVQVDERDHMRGL